MKHVVVIGGGVAGLSCATILAREKFRVTLLERRPYLGGRACTQPTTPPLDNGPHLVSGNYRMLRGLLDYVGKPLPIDAKFTSIEWFDDKNRKQRLTPGKFRLFTLWEMYRAFGLDGLRFAKCLFALSLTHQSKWKTVDDWVQHHRFSDRIRDFLRLFVMSTINTPIELTDFSLFRTVVTESLFLKGEYAKLFRVTPLTEMIITPLRDNLLQNGVDIQTGIPVTQIQPSESCITVICGSTEIECDEVVLAVPARARMLLISDSDIQYSPIVTVRIQVQGIKPGWVGFSKGAIDWVFVSAGTPAILEAVTSGNPEWASLSHQDIYRNVAEQLQTIFPELVIVKEMGIVKELTATPLQTQQWQQARLPPKLVIPHVWRASDDLATGLPATLESAACAGVWTALAITGKLRGDANEICPRTLS
ncbi:MAG: FAD-dependent oxidoreductase [bacterium]|nr:FAD-dependent oxidoreductase [bacterium]